MAEFEDLDRLLLRKVLQAQFSTPQEAFHLELGIIPISVLIKARRINFLHYLLRRNEQEMLHQFFVTQLNNPTKGDWTETVKEDLEDFGIQMNTEIIKSKSKEAFKRLVKVKAKEYGLEMLLKKKENHSKMSKLTYSELKLQSYFSIPGINIQQVRNMFKFRVRMAEVGENFRGKSARVACPLCSNHLDNQEMLFQCEVIREKVDIKFGLEDVYKDDIKIEVAEEISEIMKTREKLIEEMKK